jgi:protein ImuB
MAARRILSLWLPRLATDRLTRRRPEWRDRALVTTAGDRGGIRVIAANRTAEATGIAPGMTLADARALEPDLHPVDADPAGDARALDGMADWCGRYTPWAGLDAPDGVFLDITGCAHLFGGEAALLADLGRRLAAFGYESRAAVADTPGAAWGLARFGPAPRTVIPAGANRQAVAALPVAGLRLPADLTAALRRLGLRRIGDLYAVPRAGLAARLGSLITRRLDQALGVAAEPVSPKRPVPPHVARLAFAEPIATPDDLTAATRRLLDILCAGLERAGQGARRLDLAFFRIDGRVERSTVGTSRSVRNPAHLARLFVEKLDRIEPGLGVEVMLLTASAEPLSAVQTMLIPDGQGAASDGELAELIDRLGNRIGLHAIQRLLPRESWWPERAVEIAPALPNPTPSTSDAAPWPSDRPRPLRLLPQPEPIEVIAPIPDDPPVMFRWRQAVHRIRRADGPERIEPEWWCELDELRDYYRVEDTDGGRFWVYRAGLYQPERPARWYLHGVFA